MDALQAAKEKECWVNCLQNKIPINPKNLHNGSSTNKRTWSNHKTAVANVGRAVTVKAGNNYISATVSGVGLTLGDVSGIGGMDLDGVIDDEGNIDEDALAIIQIMNTYTEISPSGHGFHVLFTGECPIESGVKVKVNGKSRELYVTGRYFTFTGNVYGNYTTVRDCTQQLDDVCKRFFFPYIKGTAKGRKAKGNHAAKSNGNTAIGAIKRHDSGYFQRILKPKKQVFDNQEDFFNFIYHYPLDQFLGVQEGTAFCCFFHPDNNPSASVYRSGAATGKKWLYHCHAEDMTLTIKTLIEKAGDYDNEVDALDFLKSALNITISDTKWSRKQQQTIDLILDKMARTDEQSFSYLCPTASQNIRYGKSLYIQILILAKGTIYPTRANMTADVLFYMSVQQLLRATERGSRDKATKWLKCFCYHGLLKAVQDAELPKDMLNKARRTAQNDCKHISFFTIPSMVIKKLEAVERQAVRWKHNGYTLKGTSYEMFYRAEGAEVANSLYPQRYSASVGEIQTEGRAANKRAEARHDQIHEIAVNLLKEQGYFMEKQIVEQYGAKTWGSIQIKRSIADIVNTYGLTRQKASKALKQRFSIESEGYPYIYFQG